MRPEPEEKGQMSLRLREELESRERDGLASFAMLSGESAGREHDEPPPRHRTEFQRDWNRITHCQAFRKLEYKTQVFMFGEGYETVRNRLTHTLEVSQITTSICRALGLNEDLGTAIALAHDLGHPPFGHAGESILHDLVSSFNHNVHGLKIVRQLEMRYPGFRGLNLTLETLEGMEKHDTDFDRVAHHEFFPGKTPTLEAQAASAADAIAYRSHDLEDGLSSRILDEKELRSSALVVWRMIEERIGDVPEGPVRMAQISRSLIDIMIRDVLEKSEQRLKGAGIKTLEDVRGHDGVLISIGSELAEADSEFGSYLLDNFYNDYRLLRTMQKGQVMIERLFNKFRDSPKLLPPEVFERYREADEMRTEEPLRVIADYLASLTDRQAVEEYNNLFEVGSRF